MVYQMTNSSQKLFYMIGQFDGWLLGPILGINYGGIKNPHDGMCVHSHPRYNCAHLSIKGCMMSFRIPSATVSHKTKHNEQSETLERSKTLEEMCVERPEILVYKKETLSSFICSSNWGYYDGPTNMENPEDAYPYWR